MLFEFGGRLGLVTVDDPFDLARFDVDHEAMHGHGARDERALADVLNGRADVGPFVDQAPQKLVQSGRCPAHRRYSPTTQRSAAERKRQADAGIQTIELTGVERDQWNRTAQDAGWAEIKKNAPQYADELRRLLAP